MSKFNVDRFLWSKLTKNINTHVHINKHGDIVNCMTGEVYKESELKQFEQFGLIRHDTFQDYLDYMEGL